MKAKTRFKRIPTTTTESFNDNDDDDYIHSTTTTETTTTTKNHWWITIYLVNLLKIDVKSVKDVLAFLIFGNFPLLFCSVDN
jgi:hypothetical protein